MKVIPKNFICTLDLPSAWQKKLKHTMRIGTQNKLCAIIAILLGKCLDKWKFTHT